MAEYIERAKAKDELLSWAVCIKHPRHLLREDALHVLDSIPAADVAPVVHGHWEDVSERKWVYARCSSCQTVHDVKSNYCPNCGAKMDEEG